MSTRNERLAERIERPRLRRAQGAQGHTLRARGARGEQDLGAAHGERERAGCCAFQQARRLMSCMDVLPGAAASTVIPGRPDVSERTQPARPVLCSLKIQFLFRGRINRSPL